MFKSKATGLFLFWSIVALTVGLWSLYTAQDNAAHQYARSLSASRVALRRLHEARGFKRRVVLDDLMASDLVAFLVVLDEMRPQLLQLQETLDKQFPSRNHTDERREFVRQYQVDGVSLEDLFLTKYEATVARLGTKFATAKEGEDYRKALRKRFESCMAIRIEQCLWEFTYNTLPLAFAAILRNQGLAVQSRVFVVDKDGVGLADSSKPNWSQHRGFGKQTYLPMWAMSSQKPQKGVFSFEDRYFLGIAKPIMLPNRKVLAAIVVADPMDERMAREDADVIGADVIFAKGDRVIASGLQAELAARLLRDPTSVPDRRVLRSRVLEGLVDGDDLAVLVSIDTTPIARAFAMPKMTYILAVILLATLGIGLLLIFLRSLYKPFEVLDGGIHEVINGNLDYQFPFDFREEIARNLGNGLNLMVLVLQGRPLPEEEEAEQAWMQEIQVAEPVSAMGKEDEMPRLPEGIDIEALALEPADVYYKRLYGEFVEARKAVGQPIEGVNYPKFVEKLVHLQQPLMKKMGAPMIRFVVSTRGNTVTLIPVPIRRTGAAR